MKVTNHLLLCVLPSPKTQTTWPLCFQSDSAWKNGPVKPISNHSKPNPSFVAVYTIGPLCSIVSFKKVIHHTDHTISRTQLLAHFYLKQLPCTQWKYWSGKNWQRAKTTANSHHISCINHLKRPRLSHNFSLEKQRWRSRDGTWRSRDRTIRLD